LPARAGGSTLGIMSLEPRECEAFATPCESLDASHAASPHVQVPRGMMALVTYAPTAAGLDERTEVWRAGQIVPETMGGGTWSFARGTLLRTA
jgi:hypothetical protein